MIKTVTYIFHSSCPFSSCFPFLSSAPPGLKVRSLILVCMGVMGVTTVWSLSGRNMIFMLMVSLLHSGSTLGLFCMFASMLLDFAFSLFLCSFRLHPNLVSMVPFVRARYNFVVLFVTPKSSFIQLHVCISITDFW